jgi:hypothetical protein
MWSSFSYIEEIVERIHPLPWEYLTRTQAQFSAIDW